MSPVVEKRRQPCAECNEPGIRVDTDAGEIVEGGIVVASVTCEDGLLLMVDEKGRAICDDCYDYLCGGLGPCCCAACAEPSEAAHDRAMETWARAYDELNGAPESEDDR